MDVLLTDITGSPIDQIVPLLLEKLHTIGFMTHVHAHNKSDFHSDDLTHESSDKFMGVCQINNGFHRRIDLQAFKLEEWPFALLYFTGSGHFNRSHLQSYFLIQCTDQ